MIIELREYIKSVILEIDPDLSEHQQYFTSENIPDSIKEDTYFIQMNSLDTARIDTDVLGTMAVSVFIWKNGYNEVIDRIDTAYENAIEIQIKVMDQSRIDQTNFIKAINSSGIEIEAIESNDNMAQFNLQFTVTASYKSY